MTLAEAEAAERAAFAAIGHWGEVELARVKEWIAGGCESPRPIPNGAERQRLDDQLCAAIAAREAVEKLSGGHVATASGFSPSHSEIAATEARCVSTRPAMEN